MGPEFGFDPRALAIENDTSLQGLLRCLKARRLRELGQSDEEIAYAVRLPQHLVEVAVEAAAERHPEVDADDLGHAVYYLLEQQLTGLQQIFREPGFRYDVRGQALLGPDGEHQIDTERQIQAQREMSRVIEAIRRLKGTDAPQKRHLSIEEVGRQQIAVQLIEQLRHAAEISAVDTVDGEIIYDPEGPSLLLGDGGLADGEEER